jgi:transposase-like protein
MAVVAPADRSPYRGYGFPPQIIAHAVWLYFRFHLSFRDVQDLCSATMKNAGACQLKLPPEARS